MLPGDDRVSLVRVSLPLLRCRCSERQFLPPMATAAAVRSRHYRSFRQIDGSSLSRASFRCSIASPKEASSAPAPSPSPILCFIRRGRVRLHATMIRLYLSRFTLLCQAIAARQHLGPVQRVPEAGLRSVANLVMGGMGGLAKPGIASKVSAAFLYLVAGAPVAASASKRLQGKKEREMIGSLEALGMGLGWKTLPPRHVCLTWSEVFSNASHANGFQAPLPFPL
ncbi:hypothetical protein MUK42_25986 [Musa troglodytarum]|uniref:Uncharacterized protein n=1 Tax=Musa troglodytarum TaxID=320322 RepID=A0A9E7ED32_9LILI|nr:hypothetical protein MUK42_25986 [Musa troglodytarum]URD74705.1 hypothetical protein MUK42_25986 [Musa troglodytarum]URD74706.1 hypothetical protein MUK42_25986 [Musa troglodytarum]URD74707.1 hypothetical protein MUK42_25986 [Musa troglodytarum]URD74708.1 hypothetical protein MUK42_25986 [Musa troglodytarum]